MKQTFSLLRAKHKAYLPGFLWESSLGKAWQYERERQISSYMNRCRSQDAKPSKNSAKQEAGWERYDEAKVLMIV